MSGNLDEDGDERHDSCTRECISDCIAIGKVYSVVACLRSPASHHARMESILCANLLPYSHFLRPRVSQYWQLTESPRCLCRPNVRECPQRLLSCSFPIKIPAVCARPLKNVLTSSAAIYTSPSRPHRACIIILYFLTKYFSLCWLNTSMTQSNDDSKPFRSASGYTLGL